MKEILNTQLSYNLPVECRCVPQSPFYVRWLNRFGGIDYWMFEKRQTDTGKLENFEDFQPYIEDYSKHTGTNYAYSKEASELVTIGAELLSTTEWSELCRIPYSPFIQWFDERCLLWIDIMADKGDTSMLTDLPAHTIELTFIMPKIQLHF